MYENDLQSILKYLLPALIAVVMFIVAEIFTRKKRDERQRAIRNQAYKHAFVVFMSLFLFLMQLDTYLDVIWNHSDYIFGFPEATLIAVFAAVAVLIVEQIVRGSFFSSESTLGFIILMLIVVPVAAFLSYYGIGDIRLSGTKAITSNLVEDIAVAAVYVIIIAAVVKHIGYIREKSEAE